MLGTRTAAFALCVLFVFLTASFFFLFRAQCGSSSLWLSSSAAAQTSSQYFFGATSSLPTQLSCPERPPCVQQPATSAATGTTGTTPAAPCDGPAALAALLAVPPSDHELVRYRIGEFDPYSRDRARFKRYLNMAAPTSCSSAAWCDSLYTPEETLAFQSWLYARQHPVDCTTARLFVVQMPTIGAWGLGATIHVISELMRVAVLDDRVFVLDGAFFFGASHPWCPRGGFDECLFERLTSCSAHLHVSSSETTLFTDQAYCGFPTPENPVPFRGEDFTNTRVLIHRHFGNCLSWNWDQPFSAVGGWEKTRHWWRAQTSKYIVRPRQILRDMVEEERNRLFPNGIPFPLMSIHVRHGDKYKEAPDTPWAKYLELLEATGVKNNFNMNDIFLSTEDPSVIDAVANDDVRSNSTARYYRWYYTSVPRLNLSPVESAQALGQESESIYSFIQLFLAIEADFYMGTRSSNWCRLIDELRSVNGKARMHFLSPAGDSTYDL